MTIRIECIYKSYLNAKPEGLGAETKWYNKGRGDQAQALKVRLQTCLMKVERVSQEQISIYDLNH
jgi:hypothetical protein